MNIGTFTKDRQGMFHGQLRMLGIEPTSIILEPTKSKDGKPYFKITADPINKGYEIGAAFPKEMNGKTYHYVTIDSPALPYPIKAALFADEQNDGTFNLVWKRPEAKGPSVDPTSNANEKPQQTRRYVSTNVAQLRS